jgi:transmembrane sensor
MNNSENQSAIIELFVKYLQDRCTPDEVKQLSKYFETEENEETLRQLISAELNFEQTGLIYDSKEDAVLQKVKTALIAEIRQKRKQQTNHKSFTFPRWLRIAALWLLISGTAAMLATHYLFKIGQISAPIKFAIIKTEPGERKLLTIFDGTKIWLSPSSSIKFPDQLIGNLREVQLEGEAFFEVAKDKSHPFVIHSDHMDTRVVGTSFNVQSYKGQTKFKVTVVTGIVKVSGYLASAKVQHDVVLKPNQQSQFDKQNGTLKGIDFPDAQLMLKRKEGILTYDVSPIKEVLADLSRYYKVPVEIETKANSCLFSGEFDTKRPLKIVLEQLAAAINAKVVIQNDKYILKGGCEE